MQSGRAMRIAWSFLVGVTVIEGAALFWMIEPALKNPQRLAHYFFLPWAGALAWGLSILTAALYTAYAVRRSPLIGAFAFSPAKWSPYLGLRFVALAESFVTGVFEEIFFRRFVMDWALQQGAGAGAQIALSGIVFGLAHGFWGFFTGNFRAGVGASLATGVMGAALGVVYIVGARSLLPCMAAHIAINLCLEPWLILAAATGSWGRVRSQA
jgi:membrane protease YdiL (CAAX protease family)